MKKSLDNLQALVELAKETSSVRRRQLLRDVTDLFLDDTNSYSSNEMTSFDEVLCSVTDKVGEDERMELAKRLADNELAPNKLIGQLAHDVISVAAPVLEHSPVLNNDDLLSVIQNHGQNHLMAITKRREIDEPVSDALVDNGNDPVVANLLNNKGAKTSRATMEKVIAKAHESEMLRKPVVEREDAPLDLINELFFVVDKNCKRTIIGRIENATDSELEDLKTRRQAKEDQDQNLNALSEDERSILAKCISGELGETDLVAQLNNGDYKRFCYIFSCLTKLDLATVLNVTSNMSYESLAIACRAAGFATQTYSTLLMLLDENQSLPGEDMMELLELYEQLDEQTAERTLRFWQVRRKEQLGQGEAAQVA